MVFHETVALLSVMLFTAGPVIESGLLPGQQKLYENLPFSAGDVPGLAKETYGADPVGTPPAWLRVENWNEYGFVFGNV